MMNANFINEAQLRCAKVQQLMASTGVEALMVTTNVNLLYLSGRVFSGYIYLPVEGKPLYFVKRPVGLSGEGVIYVRKPEDIPSLLLERGITPVATIGWEVDQLPYSEVVRLQAAFNNLPTKNATALLKQARMKKTAFEIDQLRVAGAIHCEAYRQVPHLFVPGMTDTRFSIEIERLYRSLGSMGIVRIFGQSMEIHMGSVLAGDNAQTPSPYDFAMGGGGISSALPVSCDGTLIEQGMSVMVDVAGAFTVNMTDMTRVYRYGLLPDRAMKAHAVCLEIESEIQQRAKPGTACAELYQLALALAEKNGLADNFMGTYQQAGFIGHGIGIELNESPVLAPRSKEVLEEGMSFALEPKMVIPGVGAVGVENSYVVTANGIENMTPLSGDMMELG